MDGHGCEVEVTYGCSYDEKVLLRGEENTTLEGMDIEMTLGRNVNKLE